MKNVWWIRSVIGGWGLLVGCSDVLPAAATLRFERVSQRTENPGRTIEWVEEFDLTPEIIEQSPVLQRWLEEIPHVWEDISSDPSFPTRVRLGFVRVADHRGGWSVGLEDVFVGGTGLTLGGLYEDTGDGNGALGAEFRYYMLPLGSSVNVAPVVGYRNLSEQRYNRSGLNVGVRVLVVLSRGGGSQLSLSQTWVAPLSNEAISITTLSVAYALTRSLRISSDFQRHNGKGQIGIFMEWIP